MSDLTDAAARSGGGSSRTYSNKDLKRRSPFNSYQELTGPEQMEDPVLNLPALSPGQAALRKLGVPAEPGDPDYSWDAPQAARPDPVAAAREFLQHNPVSEDAPQETVPRQAQDQDLFETTGEVMTGFGRGLKNAPKNLGSAAFNAIMHPVDTVKGLVSGVGSIPSKALDVAELGSELVGYSPQGTSELGRTLREDPSKGGEFVGEQVGELGIMGGAPSAIKALKPYAAPVGRGMQAVGRAAEKAGAMTQKPLTTPGAFGIVSGHPIAGSIAAVSPYAAEYGGKGLQALGRGVERYGTEAAEAAGKVAPAAEGFDLATFKARGGTIPKDISYPPQAVDTQSLINKSVSRASNAADNYVPTATASQPTRMATRAPRLAEPASVESITEGLPEAPPTVTPEGATLPESWRQFAKEPAPRPTRSAAQKPTAPPSMRSVGNDMQEFRETPTSVQSTLDESLRMNTPNPEADLTSMVDREASMAQIPGRNAPLGSKRNAFTDIADRAEMHNRGQVSRGVYQPYPEEYTEGGFINPERFKFPAERSDIPTISQSAGTLNLSPAARAEKIRKIYKMLEDRRRLQEGGLHAAASTQHEQ